MEKFSVHVMLCLIMNNKFLLFVNSFLQTIEYKKSLLYTTMAMFLLQFTHELDSLGSILQILLLERLLSILV